MRAGGTGADGKKYVFDRGYEAADRPILEISASSACSCTCRIRHYPWDHGRGDNDKFYFLKK